MFVNLDRDAPSVSVYFGDVLDIISESGIDLSTLQFHSREDWQSHSNWKTMLENYLECYHCPVAHPSFSAMIDVRPETTILTTNDWVMSQTGYVRPSALEDRSTAKIYNAHGEVKQSQYHLLWPNTTININPGFPNLSLDVWMPDGPNATKGFSEQYFAPGASAEFAKDLIAFNKAVGTEDDRLTNAVQRGLLAGIPEQGRLLTTSEHLVIRFQKLALSALIGDPSALNPSITQPTEPVSRMIPDGPGS